MASIVLDTLSNLQPCNEHIKTVSQIARCKVWPPELIIFVYFFFSIYATPIRNTLLSQFEYVALSCIFLPVPLAKDNGSHRLSAVVAPALHRKSLTFTVGWNFSFLYFDEMVEMVKTVEYFFLLYFSCFAKNDSKYFDGFNSIFANIELTPGVD